MATIRVNGVAVEYRQDGEGSDLLLLHSLLTEMSVFDRVVPLLARKHCVTRVNLPGFGASAPVALNTVAEYADHAARALDALSLPPSVDVFGNGFGAFVALELAIRHHQSTYASGLDAVLDTAIGRMFPAVFQVAHPEVVMARKAALAPADAACFARACLALAALDLRPRLANIGNPTLVMCGALDQTTPPALAREVASAIPGAVYSDIEGSGHCPMLEQPEALVSKMESFISESRVRHA